MRAKRFAKRTQWKRATGERPEKLVSKHEGASKSGWHILRDGLSSPLVLRKARFASLPQDEGARSLEQPLKPRPLFENQDDRAGEALKILLADGKGRCQIDDIADGPHEDARFYKPAPQRAEIIDAIEFDDTDRAFHPHVAYMRQLAGRFETAGKRSGNGRDLVKTRFARE